MDVQLIAQEGMNYGTLVDSRVLLSTAGIGCSVLVAGWVIKYGTE